MKHPRDTIRIVPTPDNPDRYSVARFDKQRKLAEWLETPGGKPQWTAARARAEWLADRFAEVGNEGWRH